MAPAPLVVVSMSLCQLHVGAARRWHTGTCHLCRITLTQCPPLSSVQETQLSPMPDSKCSTRSAVLAATRAASIRAVVCDSMLVRCLVPRGPQGRWYHWHGSHTGHTRVTDTQTGAPCSRTTVQTCRLTRKVPLRGPGRLNSLALSARAASISVRTLSAGEGHIGSHLAGSLGIPTVLPLSPPRDKLFAQRNSQQMTLV